MGISTLVTQQHPIVAGQPARVFIGGQGPALLLIHGGWGGAAMHWREVWNELATHFLVIAPDLPGLGDLDRPGLGSVPGYAAWLTQLLDAIGVKQAWCVGESYGGTVAWSLAGRAAERCLGVVLVNGLPMPKTPALLLWLGRTGVGRAMMRVLARRISFTPKALAKAFVGLNHAPPELASALGGTPKEQLDLFVRCLVEGDGPPEPKVPRYLIWGEQDRLPGTSPKTIEKLKAEHPGVKVAHIGGAGHFPPIEQPAAFVRALDELLRVHPR